MRDGCNPMGAEWWGDDVRGSARRLIGYMYDPRLDEYDGQATPRSSQADLVRAAIMANESGRREVVMGEELVGWSGGRRDSGRSQSALSRASHKCLSSEPDLSRVVLYDRGVMSVWASPTPSLSISAVILTCHRSSTQQQHTSPFTSPELNLLQLDLLTPSTRHASSLLPRSLVSHSLSSPPWLQSDAAQSEPRPPRAAPLKRYHAPTIPSPDCRFICATIHDSPPSSPSLKNPLLSPVSLPLHSEAVVPRRVRRRRLRRRRHRMPTPLRRSLRRR
jgi:hypothetical protein